MLNCFLCCKFAILQLNFSQFQDISYSSEKDSSETYENRYAKSNPICEDDGSSRDANPEKTEIESVSQIVTQFEVCLLSFATTIIIFFQHNFNVTFYDIDFLLCCRVQYHI